MQERKTNDYKIYMMLYLKDKDIKETAINIPNKVKPTNFPTHENFTKGLRMSQQKCSNTKNPTAMSHLA